MADERASDGRNARAVLAALLIIAAAIVVTTSVFPARTGVSRTRRALEEQTAENERLTHNIERLDAEIDAVENDPRVTQRIMLDEYGMVAEDEYIIR